MSKQTGVYDNAASGDTSFRRTWNREEYAQKAAEREAQEARDRRQRYEAKLSGKKYIPKLESDGQAQPFDDVKMVEARRDRLRLDDNLNKIQLVPAGATGGRRGKGPGYYCENCDLNFTNSLEYVEHLNSKQHLQAIGQSGQVERATVEMVVERLAWLKQKKIQEQGVQQFDLAKRLEERKRQEEQDIQDKRDKKRAKKLEASKARAEVEADQTNQTLLDDDALAMARMMGFGAFGSSRSK